MIRVLMVGPVPYLYGGISKVAGSFLDAKNSGVQIDYVKTSTKKSFVYKIPVFVTGLIKVAFKLILQRPHVVHLHFSKGASLYRKLAVEKLVHLFDVPVLVHSHSFAQKIDVRNGIFPIPDFYKKSSLFSKKIIKHFLDRADAVIVLSEGIKSCFRNITRNKNIRVLPNPVDCRKYLPGDKTRGGNQILFMGDFSQSKGIHILLKAVPEVRKYQPGVQFNLCGGRREEIQDMVKKFDIENEVKIPGFVSGKEKVEFFKESDLFVLPSYGEGLPIAILEAMSSGLPIITTPVGGIPDVLEEKQNALFVCPGDHQDLSEKIIFLLKQREMRARIGANNRQKAQEEFDTPVIIRRLREIYSEVIKN